MFDNVSLMSPRSDVISGVYDAAPDVIWAAS